MGKINNWCYSFVYGKPFDLFIIVIILINSLLIGVQATYTNHTIDVIQDICLYIFTFEVVLRYIAAGTMKKYFSSGWNIFDLILVIIGWIPAEEGGNSIILVLRVLRVFRVLRLLRTAEELKLIVDVLIRSLKSLLYNGMLFLIFLYLYAVIGVTVFRLPTPDKLNGEELQRYEQMIAEAPHSPANSPDPFGSISEAFFTLFRALTGEDWTDLRYNLITASDYGLIKVHPSVVTVYHVSWFCLAAFLLLNLVTGAVINNYQVSIEQEEKRRKAAHEKEAMLTKTP